MRTGYVLNSGWHVRLNLSPCVTPIAMLLLIAMTGVADDQDVDRDRFPPGQLEFFERQVRPLLAEQCWECHGTGEAESGLRLDHRADILRGGDRGPAVMLGNPASSLLMRAISYDDEDLAMPPDGKLSPDQISVLRTWIEQRAPWPADTKADEHELVLPSAARHWAFQPIEQPVPPAVKNTAWPKNPIDLFVLAKLEAVGLTPSPPASDETLVRRAMLDLWGIPPRYADLAALRRSRSARAFDELIDHFLAGQAYGERWGRHWLDVARYADTKGYVDGGQVRFAFAYTYRDYVVRAFNRDLPFDQFVIDQLAADSQPYGDDEVWRLAGMGLLTVGRRFNHNFHDIIDDQIDVISRGFEALTVSCARCHDHKFDPIPTADYYSLHGILANSEEPQHPDLPLWNGPAEQQDPPAHLRELRKRAVEYETAYAELHAKIEHELRAFAGDYLVYLVQESPQHRTGTQNPLKTDRTILRGPSAYGFGAIRRWRDYVNGRADDDPVFAVWRAMDAVPTEDFARELPNQLAQAGINSRLREKLLDAEPKSMVELARAYGELLENIYQQWSRRSAGDPRLKALDDATDEQLRQVLYGADSPAVMSRFESIDCYYLDDHTRLRNLAGKVEELSIQSAVAVPRAMVLRQRKEPYEPVIFRRGQPNRAGERVPLRLPEAFSPLDSQRGQFVRAAGDDRLALARAIVSPENTLTARVIVNRVWLWHFGQPLVSTASDFGVRSPPPSHPRLLDFLASWLMENDWSIKKLQRLIMTSSTYQQASLPRDEGHAIDPENRLLWRFNPRRLEWEAIRDSLLAVAGRLETRVGGRPVELAPDDPASQCRTIYLRIDRQEIPRFAQYFDFPAADFTSPQRTITTVPQQQLFFLNSPFVRRQAEAIGADMAVLGVDNVARFQALYRRVLARDPTMDEPEIRQLLREMRAALGTDNDEQLWSFLAHGLLQSNEFVMIE